MATQFTDVTIGAADRRANAVRAELWRTVNAVGRWQVILRNVGGVYNGVFDIQDIFQIDVDTGAGGVTLMEGCVDGPGVVLRGQDIEDDWGEFAIISGVDLMQDFLFHNDFEYYYPNGAQFLHNVVNDVINVRLAGLTNITYAAPGASPAIGVTEFKEGTSFLGALQEIFRRAGWIFYVDDALALQSGAPGFSATGETFRSVAGAANNNIIGIVDFKERDGDKLYNYIKLYGKNPMFDAYTEYSFGLWSAAGLGATVITNDAATFAPVTGNQYSVRANNAAVNPILELDFAGNAAATNYAEVDLSKGEMGAWVHYSGGTALAGPRPIRVSIRETAAAGGNTMNYYGTSTQTYLARWGWVTAPLGENENIGAGAPNEWWPVPAADFEWDHIENIRFRYEAVAADKPIDIRVDGLSLPVPPIAITSNLPSGYRRRPFIDQRPDIRTQNALDSKATQLLTHHEGSGVEFIKFITAGNTNLRYAGQSFDVNIPSLGINTVVFYATQIHHIIEPYVDVSDGYGFDFITEVEAVPTSGVAFDMGRLRDGPLYSSSQMASRGGTGIRVK